MFKNVIQILDDDGREIARYSNAQTIANRNLLLNLYNGTNPTALALSITVGYDDGDAQTQSITSANDTTTQPTGSSVAPWNYLRTPNKYASSGFDTQTGGIILRGSIYFPESVTIQDIFILGADTLFRKSVSESVVGGKNLNILYTIEI